MSAYALVALGGAVGSIGRYVVSIWAARRWGMRFPYGTFAVNLSGSLLIGVFLTVVEAWFGDSTNARLLVATGFLGAYTTFSTFSYESLAFLRRGDAEGAVRYMVGSFGLGGGGAVVGIVLAEALIAIAP